MDQSSVSSAPARRAVVLGGKTGLFGSTLARTLRDAGWTVHAPGREDVDLFSEDALAAYIDACEPDMVFNTVAYTQVDKAEDEPEQARRVNRGLPANLGQVLRTRPVRCLHISTDFVFNGKQSTPYTVEDTPDPQSVYGSTKLEGERALLERIPDRAIIARTAWLFGPGKKNFVQTILGLCRERSSLNVVHDQVGSPTYTVDLAAMCLQLAKHETSGLYHLVNAGQASWCELAAEAAALAELPCIVHAIPSNEYPQKACRPAYSVLDTSRFTETTGITPRPWIQALRDYIFHDLWNTELIQNTSQHSR
jgi:dTDP-4-dehydrorhamnose reductase